MTDFRPTHSSCLPASHCNFWVGSPAFSRLFSIDCSNQGIRYAYYFSPPLPVRFVWGIALLWIGAISVQAQTIDDAGYLTGSFQANGNAFIRDTAIGAANTPQYDRQLYGAEAWLGLNYNRWGFDMGIRFDLFNNSNLLNPQGSYSAQGIGRWYIKKKIHRLNLAAGYLYDQIGSGIIFRTYEERPLAIDNALLGVSVGYELTPNWSVKALTGKQKQQFTNYSTVIRALHTEGFINDKNGKWSLAPGFGLVHKTLDDETMDQVVSVLSSYTPQDSIGAKYNNFAFSAYNTLSAGRFTWYVEGAYKTPEVIFDPFEIKHNWNGTTSIGKFVMRPGNIVYSSVSYAAKGLGVTLEGKRTQDFVMRVNPFVTLNRGMLNFLPPMSRQNTYRLTARYNPASQELGEKAVQLDIHYNYKRKWWLGLNLSNITTLRDLQLYREIHAEGGMKKKQWQLLGGIQLQYYNQEVYENKPGVPVVQTITPYAEFLYKFDKLKSLRIELQYMDTHEDFGSWIFGLAEFGIAPHWIFTISDMYNVRPKKTDDLHYYTAGVVYLHHTNRLSLSYVKQVEGVVCTGGICRLEPAFNGVRTTVSTTF